METGSVLKRKLEASSASEGDGSPTKNAKKKKGRKEKGKKIDRILKAVERVEVEEPKHALPSSLSIAIPGSILDNAQSQELRTYVAGQIARAACIYCVDEIIVFDDSGGTTPFNKIASTESAEGEMSTIQKSCVQMARILQYLECPQYLRKFFFPLHRDLKYCGLLNPLDAPHHLRQSNEFQFREGVVCDMPAKTGSFVNIGLLNNAMVDQKLSPGIRVTCELRVSQDIKSKKIKADVVPPTQPRSETGVYWGYTVRLANSLSQVITKCPYDDGYDLTIGTSDKGQFVSDVPERSMKYKHALIVFGGVLGLEQALQHDPEVEENDPSLIYDHYLNTVPAQGSRTIRTEEAVLLSLASLIGGSKMSPEEPAKEFKSDAVASSEDTRTTQHFSKNVRKFVKGSSTNE